MNTYVVLLRGVNVGGKNKVSMIELKKHLEGIGFMNVSTYINSGNVVLQTGMSAPEVKTEIEAILSNEFTNGSDLIKALVLDRDQLKEIVEKKPKHFGDRPEDYYSDVIFLMGIDEANAMQIFTPREGVDAIWRGRGVIYSQRLGAERTKSRLNRIMMSPLYKSMTIRNWNTTMALLRVLSETERK